MKLSASTTIYGIFGNPARHSKSPIIQNAWIEDFGINAAYLAFEPKIENFEKAFLGLVDAGLKGCNITAPFKERAANLVLNKARDVALMGAANTIIIEETSIGYNTDGLGLILDLDKRGQDWRNNNDKIAIIGVGGATKGIIDAFIKSGVKEFNFIARDKQKINQTINLAKNLDNADLVNFNPFEWGDIENGVEDCGLIINATTIGLKGEGKLVFDLAKSRKKALIYDMVYYPSQTDFFNSAINQNRLALNGSGMLVGQGALAFEKWFGELPDFDIGLKRLIENA